MASAVQSKKVAIIGAGLAGLVTLKECLTEGLSADVFEGRSEIGGQWAYQATPDSSGELQSSMYEGVILNSCRDTTGFSDFPIDPARHGDYFTHREMHRYILEYASHFGLEKHISLSTKVLVCEPSTSSPGKWTVRFQKRDAEPEEGVYDSVISASGFNSIPLVPEFRNRKAYEGEFLHSHYYRTPGRFEGKRMVIIGAGSCAVDMASELAPSCREVHFVTRRGAWIIPRFVLGKPAEAWDNRATQILVPAAVSEWMQTVLLNLVQGKHPPELQPKHRLMQQNPTLRTEFIERVRTGTIKVHRAEVESFDETGVILSNGTKLEADVVLSCTGYKRAYPYLPADTLHNSETPMYETDLYKLVVPARHPNLYLVGCIESPGPAPPVLEAQARYVLAAITNRITLPSSDGLLKEIRTWQKWHAKSFVRSERHSNTETYAPYIDSLLKPLGANPSLGRLVGQVFTSGSPLESLLVLNAVYFSIMSAAQWRLFGHGKKPELARETLVRVSNGKGRLSKGERELLSKKQSQETATQEPV